MKNALRFWTPRDLFSFDDDFFGNLNFTNFTNSPKVNVKETDKAYEIEIANPGFSKDETKIEIKDRVLYVSMNSETKEEDKEHKYHVRQWSKSSYQEAWDLPENVIEEEITAKNNDGVLTITLPKKEIEPKKDESRTIEIE